MHSTGIEPVLPPWKGGILPLNYECMWIFVIHCCRRFYFKNLNADYAGHPPPPVPPPGDTGPDDTIQLSPFVIPSHVSP